MYTTIAFATSTIVSVLEDVQLDQCLHRLDKTLLLLNAHLRDKT